MHCRELEEMEVETERLRLEGKPHYVPQREGRGAVEFRFNLDSSGVGESLFVILSNRTGTVVYRGPYRSTVVVEIDAGLSTDEGYDHLEFWLLQPQQKRLCNWINERGEPYWRPGIRIGIKFSQESTIDEDGLMKRFEVITQ